MPRPSLVYQVESAIKRLQNKSKKTKSTKKAKKETIYHGKTAKVYVEHCCTYAKWCREKYRIGYLKEITPEMTVEYFKKLNREGKSAYTQAAIRSALKKLEIGLRKLIHHRVKIVPEDLKVPRRSLANRQGRRAYTDKEMNAILYQAKKINEEAYRAMQVELMFGLRRSEVLNLRVTDIHIDRGVLVVWRGKGGRLREVPIDAEAEVILLNKLTQGKGEMDKIFPNITEKDLEYVITEACKRAGIKEHKNHNIRHTYAVSEYKRKTGEEGKTDKEARKEISQLLGHNRVEVVNSYVPARIQMLGGRK